MFGDLLKFTKLVGSKTRKAKLCNVPSSALSTRTLFSYLCFSKRSGIPLSLSGVLSVPWISQCKFLFQLRWSQAIVLFFLLKSLLLPRHLPLQGRWHFHNAYCKDGQGFANDCHSQKMVLVTMTLMDHSPPFALLTCTGRATHIRNSSRFNVMIGNWNLCN